MEYSRKVHYIRLSVFSLIIFLFLISSFIFLISNKKERRLFIFPSVDEGNYVVEYRYLEKNPVIEAVKRIIPKKEKSKKRDRITRRNHKDAGILCRHCCILCI